jgi:hypothetical protein
VRAQNRCRSQGARTRATCASGSPPVRRGIPGRDSRTLRSLGSRLDWERRSWGAKKVRMRAWTGEGLLCCKILNTLQAGNRFRCEQLPTVLVYVAPHLRCGAASDSPSGGNG